MATQADRTGTSAEAVAAASNCRNCGFSFAQIAAAPKFCPQCGQDTHLHPPTVGEFLHEFVLHYVALEGKLWRTLGLLFFRPGALTIAYLSGLKGRYVPPLRLYLTASILFFLIVKFFGAGSLFRTGADVPPVVVGSPQVSVGTPSSAAPPTTNAAAPAVRGEGASHPTTSSDRKGVTVGRMRPQGVQVDGVSKEYLQRPAMDVLKCDLDVNACPKIRDYLAKRYDGQTVGQMGTHVKNNILSFAPYAMFFFLPVFALLLKIVYRGRGMYYGEHLVYAFHVHAFSFLMLLGIAFAPDVLGGPLTLWVAVYFWWAMRRVYGGRWWATSLRYFTIGMIYPLLLTLLIAAVVLAAIFV